MPSAHALCDPRVRTLSSSALPFGSFFRSATSKLIICNAERSGSDLPSEEDGKGDTGCERVGLLELRYTSKAKNCAPDKQVRAVLKMRTLCGAETTYHTN